MKSYIYSFLRTKGTAKKVLATTLVLSLFIPMGVPFEVLIVRAQEVSKASSESSASTRTADDSDSSRTKSEVNDSSDRPNSDSDTSDSNDSDSDNDSRNDRDVSDTPDQSFDNEAPETSDESRSSGSQSQGQVAGAVSPQTGSITVCKIILDEDGEIVTHAGIDNGKFLISSFATTTSQGTSVGTFGQAEFEMPVTLNTDLVDDNGNDLDATCIKFDGLTLNGGGYYYAEEHIKSNDNWLAPRYNDYITGQTNLNDFYHYDDSLFTDGDPDNNRDTRVDGHIILTESWSDRILVVVNQLGESNACDIEFVSDTSNTVVDSDTPAVVTNDHPNWTSIPGASWIWSSFDVQDPLNNETETFRKTFNVPGNVVNGFLELAADNTYSVEINGVEVSQSGAEDNFSSTVTVDVTSYLNDDDNEILFTVTNIGLVGGTEETNPAGALYKLSITSDDCTPDEDEVTVTVYKYIDGEMADASTTGYEFQMVSNPNNEFVLGTSSNFTYTEDRTIGTGYLLAEVTTATDALSMVTPFDGECPAEEPCLADLNSDGVVNNADLQLLLGNWGACEDGENPCIGDIVTNATLQEPKDQIVDGADLAYLLGNWGPCRHYILRGYKVGATLQEAENATLEEAAGVAISSLDADTHIIVMNDICVDEPENGGSDGSGGNGGGGGSSSSSSGGSSGSRIASSSGSGIGGGGEVLGAETGLPGLPHTGTGAAQTTVPLASLLSVVALGTTVDLRSKKTTN